MNWCSENHWSDCLSVKVRDRVRDNFFKINLFCNNYIVYNLQHLYCAFPNIVDIKLFCLKLLYIEINLASSRNQFEQYFLLMTNLN